MELWQTLEEHERVWQRRPLLRRIYIDWFRAIAAELASVPGSTVELGAGTAHLKDVVPAAVATDVEPTPWAEAVVDAEAMPYADGEVANLVLVDVFHHLRAPARFLDEAARVLADGGRVVTLEPYCSQLSTVAYKRFHHELLDLSGPAFDDDARVGERPLDANIARPTLAFFRHDDELARRWPELRLVRRRLLSALAYPLSGGYSRRQLVPAAAYTPLTALERLLAPVLPLVAFRCLVVLERQGR